LPDVDALEKVGQLRFLDWLDSTSKRLQVVSTAKAPLLRLVQAHKFNPSLYYRLNTVYIDLTVEKVGRAIL
jgi:DNA-binding NtrC family response regulator